jgi:chromosome segregation ATPase
VRYLAEIQKQSKGFMGGFETKLKLLACEGGDRSWNVVPGNESISIEDTGSLGDGALVMVNLSNNRQIQGTLEPASTRIIGVLQSFSRLLEKSKSQEEEIETWKESLTIQSEQLSSRELEMETRLEQLERMEEEFNQFEEQRQAISTEREEVEVLRRELNVKNQELAQQWQKLQEEQQRLEQNLKEGKFLDESQAVEIQNLLDCLSSEINSTGSCGEDLHSCLGAIDRQQELLTKYWQKLEQNHKTIEQDRQSYLQSQSVLKKTQTELDSLLVALEESQQQLQKERQLLDNKQELITVLVKQEQYQGEIQDSLDRAGIESNGVALEQKIDVKALENMPLSELEAIVTNLQKDLEKVAQFVHDQEEELSWQCQAVDELEQKIQAASEFDRLALDQELAEEKEAKKMLDETLVGQRRALKERHEIFLQHSRILKRRQGVFDLEAELQSIDLEPLKDLVRQQRQSLLQQKALLDSEATKIEQNIDFVTKELQKKVNQKENFRHQIQEQSNALEKLNLTIVTMEAESSFFQANLQPLQDSLNQIRQYMEKISSYTIKDVETGKTPNEVLMEIDRMIKGLVGT